MVEQELGQALATNPRSVMIIVGAGVTLGALQGTGHHARASWAGLIRDGLEYAVELRTLDREDAQRLEGLLQSNRTGLWISAAEQLTEALGGPTGGDFKAWLRRSVGSFAATVRDRSVLDVLADLERLGATIATVNYDSMLEGATGQRAVTWRQSSEVERVLRGDARGILHLHGHWEDPASIVLGTTSYGDVVRDAHARAVLESMRMFRTLVFVGHGAGLRDPNWGSFLDWTAEVFAGAEYRHYRIAREAEIPALLTPELQAQRISLVGYKGGYENLGPFLRSLVPNPTDVPSRALAGAPPSIPTPPEPIPEHILLLVNIGENDHHFVSAADVRSHGGVPQLAKIIETPRRELDLRGAGPREWRTIAADIDVLVANAEAAARDASAPVCFVIAGAAPLPVFVYLGYHFKRIMVPVLFVNRNDITGAWDRIGPFRGRTTFPSSLRELFKLELPMEFRNESGKVALFVASSTVFQCSPALLAPVTTAESHTLNCIFRVTTSVDPKANPAGIMVEGDLAWLTELVSRAETAAQQRCPKCSDMVLAYGGPTWGAFWLGRTFNPKVSGNIDFPNHVRGTGYVPALASQMWRQRWVSGEPKLLVLAAEPDDEPRTRAGAQLTAVDEGIAGVRGRRAPDWHVRCVQSTQVSKLVGILLDEHRTDILHVYAHGGPDGTLGFEDDRGNCKPIRPEQFLAVLRATGVRPSLTVVCACHSATLAPALLEVSECVVNVRGTVPYVQATAFIGAFYGALARGLTVAKAFALGLTHVNVTLDPVDPSFEIVNREGVDPARMFFWWPPRH